MYSIGQSLPASLRETAEGGLAATPTGRRLEAEIFGQPKVKLIDYIV
jgi:L-serine dehydratase